MTYILRILILASSLFAYKVYIDLYFMNLIFHVYLHFQPYLYHPLCIP